METDEVPMQVDEDQNYRKERPDGIDEAQWFLNYKQLPKEMQALYFR